MRANFLKGVRFTDFTWAGAGTFGTKVFSDFGAEVLKIESMTRPDNVRMGVPFKDGIVGVNRSGYFASRNTGKKSVALNLKTAEAHEIALALIAKSDVVSNNFGPGVMERLDLGYETLRKIKPDLIYLSMPVYGHDGPRAKLLGVGMTISAVTGIMWHTAYGPDDPVGPGTHYPDHAANPYHAAFAVLAALVHRRESGRGMKIDLSQVESTVNFVGPGILEASATQKEAPQIGNRSRNDAPHNIFRARGDDSWVAIAVLNDGQWRTLARAMDRQDLLDDAGLATAAGRMAALERVEAAVTAWTASRDAEAIVAQLRPLGIPVAVVASSRYLVERDTQLAARNYWQHPVHPEVGPILLSSLPFTIDGERVDLVRPPLFGEHTTQVLHDLLGLSAEQVADLQAKEALS
jgi:benzylsuccinate CoA-transferase BbsF subunit